MNKQKNDMNAAVRKTRMGTMLIAGIAIIILTLIISGAIVSVASKSIRENASRLISANSRQLQLNINSYLDKVEMTSALLFSEEICYEFDATDESIDEYEKLTTQEEILNRIVDIGIMENFSDFGIVYADDSTVGWISNGTRDLLDRDEVYNKLCKYISNEKTKDGWFAGINGNYDRLYYVKRLNKNAIILASIYSRELANVFEFPEELDGMVIRLEDAESNILYSSDKDEIGSKSEGYTTERLGNLDEVSAFTKDNLYFSSMCTNGWSVVCEVPTELVLRDITRLRNFTGVFVIIVAIIFMLAIFVAIRKASSSIATVVLDLNEKAENDGLSGLLNKISFENKASSRLDAMHKAVFGMIDVDYFKSVNDTLGHDHGDKVIIKMGDLLRKVMPEETILGRLGGDEFGFIYENDELNHEELRDKILSLIDSVNEKFAEIFEEEKKVCNISLSVGVYIPKDNTTDDFESAYKKVDAALYVSKNTGKNRCTFYEKGMEVAE